jgi:signal transduction histidine kinase
MSVSKFRPMRCIAFVCVWLTLAFACIAPASAEEPTLPGRIEAVRSDWNVQTPPDSGWIEVTLPDDWSKRWPQFDGVVWYRLTWNQPEPVVDTGLYIDYIILAGVVSVNGSVLTRDESLVEPLSRTWNRPRYFRLPAALLHSGENILLVRASGMAAYEGGLGPIRIGAPEPLHDQYQREYTVRHDWQIFGFTTEMTLGAFFLALWLIRRREVAYGWYGAGQLVFVNWSWNQITTSVWPFPNTDLFEAANTATLLVFVGCYMMFVLRFSERRWPRREVAIWLAIAAGSLWVFLAPHESIRQVRALLTIAANLFYFVPNALLVWFSIRPNARTDQRILAAVGLANLVAATHDTLQFIGVLKGYVFYSGISGLATTIGVAFVLAWNFTRNLHRIEGFNVELQRNIDEARAELATTLSRQHDLELVHARLGERVSLAHDLHDGLGGMLIGNIAALEQAPEHMSSRKVLDMFRELRDDLRLIIDTASAQHYGEHSLAELLAPLRHRMTRLFEAHDIDVRWRIDGLDGVYLSTTQSLDVLRILQEALANVLKHSAAKHVEVEMTYAEGALSMEVSDNGVGMSSTDASAFGTGMRSMHSRARRLGGALTVGSEHGATVVRLCMPWLKSSNTSSTAQVPS